LKKDTEFLKKHNLMDYSLLFAVENNIKVQIELKKKKLQEEAAAKQAAMPTLNSTLVGRITVDGLAGGDRGNT
jgi:Phosphatidylinositol-4-phosphate 5-Kinase